jgi:hypothetical protein
MRRWAGGPPSHGNLAGALSRPVTCQDLGGLNRQTPRQEALRAVRIVPGTELLSRMSLLPAHHRSRLLV